MIGELGLTFHPHQCFFFQFADSVRVASIPRQIQTDFVKFTTLFQRILKTAPSRHKCDNTLNTPPLPPEKIAVGFW